jgi:nitroimidazol reductase NimA-like FMN-containing flavoprotein (pyridoxamine 5'-phosphate oxidase superfamily)
MSDQDESSLVELSAGECEALLATHQIGRLGVNAEHYPLIFVVNYGLDRGVVVIRTHPGTKLSNANHANVTFEVDDIDRRTRSGWSVLIRGLAEELTPDHRADLIERTLASAVQP